MYYPTNVEVEIISDEDTNNDDHNITKQRDAVSLIKKVLQTCGNKLKLEDQRRKLEYLLKDLSSSVMGNMFDKNELVFNKLKTLFGSALDDEVIVIADTPDLPDLQSTTKNERSFNPASYSGISNPSATIRLAAECAEVTQENHSKLITLVNPLDDEVIVIDDTTDSTDLQSTIEGEHRINPSPPQFTIATADSAQFRSQPPTPPVTTNPLTADSADSSDLASTSKGTELPCSTNQPIVVQLGESIYERRSNSCPITTTIRSPEANCLSSLHCNDQRGRNPTLATLLQQQQQQNQQQSPADAIANDQHLRETHHSAPHKHVSYTGFGQARAGGLSWQCSENDCLSYSNSCGCISGNNNYRCLLNNNKNNNVSPDGSFVSAAHRIYREHRLAIAEALAAKQTADQQCQLKAKEKPCELGKKLTIVADKECVQLGTSYLNNKKIDFNIPKNSNSFDISKSEKSGDKCEQHIANNVIDKKGKHAKEMVNVENQPPTQGEKLIEEHRERTDQDGGKKKQSKAAEKNTERLPKLPKMLLTDDNDSAAISIRNIINSKRRPRLANMSLNEELLCKERVQKQQQTKNQSELPAAKRPFLELNVDSNAPSYDYGNGRTIAPSKSIESSSQTTESSVTPTSGQISSPDGRFVNHEDGLNLKIIRVFSLANP